MKLSKREREVMREWEAITGFEFMGPDHGEPFVHALRRNKRWLAHMAGDAERIGSDLESAAALAQREE